ncbi:DNA mismatch repair protein MutS [Mariniplasma anaerobium]|uniref:DNA mismatch repair protein MutS n=1 Tax=Mariniplasma anaerobium TaxID=2735436 RepID=A0A7U9TI59_9MOLU|nr:DNA mismatch repair protein MutS [Mariniplasma anaerobium]BCR35664.1 DNA mismatch repair protein MutS [Mariniplasma anaerobium]
MDNNNYTPMMQQYLEIKEDYADAIVFFRLGDFYEMFFDDAILASKVLEIALTSRDAGAKVPMCGIPHHAVKPYIQKLIEKGFKIAIAEQITEAGKGLVKREVIRLITPGTVFEDGILDQNKNNFIASVILTEKGYATTYIDISTGESFITDNLVKKEALDLILSLDIKEVVCPTHFDKEFINELKQNDLLVSHADDYTIHEYSYMNHLEREQKRAASHLLNYLSKTQMQTLNHLMPFTHILKVGHMHVDYRVKKHLEIMESLTNSSKTTLEYWINHCQTAMGSRLLKAYLNQPLNDKKALNERYDYIEAFFPYKPREDMLEHLKYIYDINRIVGRISFQSVNARDLFQLKETLNHIPFIIDTLKLYDHPKIQTLAKDMKDHKDLREYLEKAIHENPPITVKDGGIIKDGFNEQLDDLRYTNDKGQSWLNEFESSEREKTGIKNLRVGYNRVFGYYIEISKGNTQFVKDEFGYERKQTLTNSERYISPVLKEKEDQILNAKERAISLEYELFKEIRIYVEKYTHDLQLLSTQIAMIDVFLNLAIISEKYQFIRPHLHDSRLVDIKEGRHPVVEKFTTFIKNDVVMDQGEIFLITGPNMSGKSTYMRMFAIIVYMAQIGCFVPAAKADMPLYDALYTRIGSSDDLSGGKSTFMVEMVESNDALTNATKDSLILFDEIGRGTATYDGMALAQGMIEYIHEKIGAQTLFSTHYHELTVLEHTLSRLTNLCVKAKEENDKMVFLHHVEKGTTDKSYGIQVASLAHLPKSLITRSKRILEKLEDKENKVSLDLFNYEAFEEENQNIIDAKDVEVLEELAKIDTDQMTPIDALLLIKHLQNIIKK